jgi:hypothetical protein
MRLGMKSLFFLSLFLLLPEAPAQQNTAFLQTDAKNRAGSDDSLRHSTVYAMSALMDLGNMNVPAAVNNGMTAYGKYRNSETLDRLSNANIANAAALSSAGTAAPSLPPKIETTFRRLDPGFLRQGKYAQVAAEFEKKSGMKREQFLSQLSEASEKKIKRSDPHMVEKVVGRFESFLSTIPNAGFRNNLKKGVALVPQSIRTGLISKAVARFAGGASGVSAPEIPSPQQPAQEMKAESVPAKEPEKLAAAPEQKPEVERAPASQDTASPEATNTKTERDPIHNAVLAALDTQEESPSIFQQVSQRYRVLTPQLTGQK